MAEASLLMNNSDMDCKTSSGLGGLFIKSLHDMRNMPSWWGLLLLLGQVSNHPIINTSCLVAPPLSPQKLQRLCLTLGQGLAHGPMQSVARAAHTQTVFLKASRSVQDLQQATLPKVAKKATEREEACSSPNLTLQCAPLPG